MTPDQIAVIGLILVMFALFAWNKWRYDVVAVIALVALVALDAILGGETSKLVEEPKRVLEGFGHPAVVTVAAVLIISRALRNSGVVDQISRSVMPFTKNQISHILSLSLVVMVLSAFMNNVGALALMLPVALKTAVDRQRSPTILLLPMAFASILGGMMTMIGTPPNIIIASLRAELTDEPAFGLFDFSPVGGLVAIAGLLFIVLVGWRLIPAKSHKKPGMESLFQIDDYITEISTPDGCKWIGKTVTEVEELVGEKMTLFGFIRKDDKVLPPNPDGIIQEGCRYVVKADPVELQALIEEHGLHLSTEMRHRIDSLKGENTGFTEAIVTAGSPLLGRTRTYLRRHSGNTMTLMAVARQNKPIRKQLKEVVFRVGDVLLLHGKTPEMDDTITDLSLLPLAERELKVGTFSRIGLSVAIFAGAIGLSMTGFPMTIAFLGAVLAYILCGILPLRDIYREVEWPIIVLLGAMIPVSQAFQSTGLHRADRRVHQGPDRRPAAVVDDHPGHDRDHVPLRHHQQRRHGVHHGPDRGRHLRHAWPAARPVFDGGGGGGVVRVPDPHRAPVQRHDFGAGWLPFRRLLAGWPAAGNRHSHPRHTTHRPILALVETRCHWIDFLVTFSTIRVASLSTNE